MTLTKNYLTKPSTFLSHITRNACMCLVFIAIALFIGMLGYHVFEHMPWVDSFLNASMILSGMGPAATLATTGGKIFAGFYALFSGLAFIAIIVIMISPLIHHLFHKIHLESGKSSS